MGSAIVLAPAYHFQYFDRSDTEPVAYLRSHAGHERFQDAYERVVKACRAWLETRPDAGLALLLGRHMRLGPEPPWLAVWRVDGDADAEIASPLGPDIGVDVHRTEAWEAVLEAHDLPDRPEPSDALYYVEWLRTRHPSDWDDEGAQLVRALSSWSDRHPDDHILLVLKNADARLYWVVRRFGGLERLDRLRDESAPAREADLYRSLELVDAGIYRDFGTEQL